MEFADKYDADRKDALRTGRPNVVRCLRVVVESTADCMIHDVVG